MVGFILSVDVTQITAAALITYQIINNDQLPSYDNYILLTINNLAVDILTLFTNTDRT